MSDSDSLRERANRYVQSREMSTDLDFLGEGTDGSVWLTQDRTAVKVLIDSKQFETEVECYRRLHGTEFICGYAVPKLIDSDAALLAIEMTTVQPPYILDFGKAHLDHHPEFSKEAWQYLYKEIKQIYAERYEEVMRVVRSLERWGIFYYDIKPKNILPKDWNPSLDDHLDSDFPDDYLDDVSFDDDP
jgi:hypothetical protein